MHLFLIVHGFYGNEDNMLAMKKALKKKLPKDKCLVYVARSNELIKTFDGIPIGAFRIYEELIDYIANKDITRISIIGYSLGGLYSRYLIGLLEDQGLFDIIEPVIFATFATPHLGSLFWYPSSWRFVLNSLGKVYLGPSGAQLMSRSSSGVVSQLSDLDGAYIAGLKQFKRRILIANGHGDRTVPFWTAFITDKLPFDDDKNGASPDIKFYDYNKNRYGPFLVDLENSAHRYDDAPQESTKGKTSFFFWLVVVPIGITLLTLVSGYSWLRSPFLYFYWRHRHNQNIRTPLKEKLDNRRNALKKSDGDDSSSTSDSLSVVYEATEGIQDVMDDIIPSDDEDQQHIDLGVANRRVTSEPLPASASGTRFLDSARHSVPLSRTVANRMHNLNSLQWEKYAVYLEHYRTHAFIIDRLHEGPSTGTEVLRFFSELAASELPDF